MTYKQHIFDFLKTLELNLELPQKIEALNPFQGSESSHIWPILESFYARYYNDEKQRKLILGINPGRLGAGSTGLPFTDTKRLNANCKIPFNAFATHEPSSVFVYDVIEAFGGPQKFYGAFYISSVSPLGFITEGKKGPVNINYYDDKNLERAIRPFVISCLKKQLDWGLNRDAVWILGTGKNYKYFNKLNSEFGFFREVIPLEHPRFVMQYRAKRKEEFIAKYLEALSL